MGQIGFNGQIWCPISPQIASKTPHFAPILYSKFDWIRPPNLLSLICKWLRELARAKLSLPTDGQRISGFGSHLAANRTWYSRYLEWVLNNSGKNPTGFQNLSGLGTVYPYFLRRYLLRIPSFCRGEAGGRAYFLCNSSGHPPASPVNGNQWQSMGINGNQWQSMAINGNQWFLHEQSMSNPRPFNANQSQWQSMAINGNQWFLHEQSMSNPRPFNANLRNGD